MRAASQDSSDGERRFWIAVDDGDLVSGFSQTTTNRRPDAACTACYNGDWFSELRHLVSPPLLYFGYKRRLQATKVN